MDFVENATPRKVKLMEQLTARSVKEEFREPGVLANDHPLLEKFQASLKAHLLRVQKQLTDEIETLDHSIKIKSNETEEVGAVLYDLQQQTLQQRKMINDYSNRTQEKIDKRLANEANIVLLKSDYEKRNFNFKQKKQAHNELLMELDHLQVLENNISKWSQEIKDEVEVAKRVVNKDSRDKIIVADEKRKSDMLLFNLDSEIRHRERELVLINTQIKEQDDILKILNQSLTDANTDLETLQQEHHRLMQAWGEVIIGIQQRDKVLSKIKTDLYEENQEQKVIQANIESTKKSAYKEMMQNEKLEAFRNRLINDIESLEKQVEEESLNVEKLLKNNEKFNAILEKTESDLQKSNQEGIFIQTQLKNLQTKLEKQSHLKFDLEEKVLELLQDQITTDKAGQFRTKLLRQTQEQRRNLEINMSATENQLSVVILDLEQWRGILRKLNEDVAKLEKIKEEADKKSNKFMEEINTTKNSLNIKMRNVDLLNRELIKLIAAAGGQELSPDQIRIITLERNISEIDNKIKDTQNFWLRLQSHVVSMTDKRANQTNEIHIARKQLLVIEQKNLKIESDLDRLNIEDREAVRNLGKLNTKIDILSTKLFKRKRSHEIEETECELTHFELTEKLRSAEMSMLCLKNEIDELEKEIEKAKIDVVEKHREALLWETKFKIAVETKKYREDELAQNSEIGCMKAEIHRMEVRLAQLKRAQEKLVQDLDNSIQHREHIFDAASTKDKIFGVKSKTRTTVQLRLNEIKNKLRQINSEISLSEKNIAEYSNEQSKVKSMLEQKQRDIEDEKLQDTLLQSEIEQGLLLKQENLENIVRKQKRVKRYKVLATSGTTKGRSETAILQDIERQREVHEHIFGIVEGLFNEYPTHKFHISRILQTLRED